MLNNTLVQMKFPKLFTKSVLIAAQKHAVRDFPTESVGVVIDKKYVPLRNSHKEPENHWRVPPKELASVMKQGAEAIIHSHPNGQWAPSKKDMEAQVKLAIPFGVLVVNESGAGNILWWGDSVPRVPLLGRPYCSGIYDCFGLARDYFREQGVELREYPREDLWWEHSPEEDFFVKNFKREKFEIVTDEPQPGDVMIMQIRSKVPNHCAVYTGGDTIIHHLSHMLSREDSASRFMPFVQFRLRRRPDA